MTDEAERRVTRQRAIAMRDLSDDDRDAAIAAAGNIVIDKRGVFSERRKAVELARSYRAPNSGGIA